MVKYGHRKHREMKGYSHLGLQSLFSNVCVNFDQRTLIAWHLHPTCFRSSTNYRLWKTNLRDASGAFLIKMERKMNWEVSHWIPCHRYESRLKRNLFDSFESVDSRHRPGGFKGNPNRNPCSARLVYASTSYPCVWSSFNSAPDQRHEPSRICGTWWWNTHQHSNKFTVG